MEEEKIFKTSWKRLEADSYIRLVYQNKDNQVDPWQRRLRQDLRRIHSWYSNRKLQIETRKHHYTDEDLEWRECLTKLASDLGYSFGRKLGWEKVVTYSVAYLYKRSKPSGSPIVQKRSWSESLRMTRRVLVKAYRDIHGDQWIPFLMRSRGYLVQRIKQ